MNTVVLTKEIIFEVQDQITATFIKEEVIVDGNEIVGSGLRGEWTDQMILSETQVTDLYNVTGNIFGKTLSKDQEIKVINVQTLGEETNISVACIKPLFDAEGVQIGQTKLHRFNALPNAKQQKLLNEFVSGFNSQPEEVPAGN